MRVQCNTFISFPTYTILHKIANGKHCQFLIVNGCKSFKCLGACFGSSQPVKFMHFINPN